MPTMSTSSTVKWPWPKPVTPRAEKVLTTLAQEQARKFGSAELLPEHFLLAMLAEGTGLGCRILTSLKVHAGLNVEREELQSLLEGALPGTGPAVTGEIPVSKRGERLFELTAEAARNMLDAACIGTEHILMGAAVEPGSVLDRYFTRTGAHDMIMFALVCSDGENPGVAGPSE
jgi:ATP-dependent Clp protease ATP-binding subunit ClpC